MAQLLKQDLAAAQRFLTAHKRCQSNAAFQCCVAQQAHGFATKLAHVGVGVAEAVELMEMLDDGPWTSAAKQIIVDAITKSTSVLQPMTSRSATAARNGMQVMKSAERYMTETLWGKLHSETMGEKAKLDAFT